MLTKKEIKDIQSLSHKKERDALNLFVAEGPKVVSELVSIIPDSIVQLYATADWINDHPGYKNARQVSQEELERISQLQSPKEVLALIKKFDHSSPDHDGVILYLDTIQDPGNFGTIIRIADWFGIQQVVCTQGCADLYNPKVVQASMASIARVRVYYDENKQWLKTHAGEIYAAVLSGKVLKESEKIKKGVLIIGNESKGISAEILAMATKKITIPKKGQAESLNAAVATGIILSHLLE